MRSKGGMPRANWSVSKPVPSDLIEVFQLPTGAERTNIPLCVVLRQPHGISKTRRMLFS